MSKDFRRGTSTGQSAYSGTVNPYIDIDWATLTGWNREKHVTFKQKGSGMNSLNADHFIANAAENVVLSFAGFFKEVMEHAAVLEKEIGNQALEQFHLSSIQDSCAFGVNLIYRLLVIHGKIPIKQEQLDLNDIVRSIDPFVSRMNPGDILFEIDMADEDLPMLGDTQLIKQAIAEILLNASDALPSGGIITLATRKVKMAKNPPDYAAYGENGGCALLSVVDTGKGMNAETGQKIFRPFFTTKPTGKGTGLGLPLVDHVVRAHNGSMKIMSKIGEGTSIRVYLPLMKSETRMRVRDITTNSYKKEGR